MEWTDEAPRSERFEGVVQFSARSTMEYDAQSDAVSQVALVELFLTSFAGLMMYVQPEGDDDRAFYGLLAVACHFGLPAMPLVIKAYNVVSGIHGGLVQHAALGALGAALKGPVSALVKATVDNNEEKTSKAREDLEAVLASPKGVVARRLWARMDVQHQGLFFDSCGVDQAPGVLGVVEEGLLRPPVAAAPAAHDGKVSSHPAGATEMRMESVAAW